MSGSIVRLGVLLAVAGCATAAAPSEKPPPVAAVPTASATVSAPVPAKLPVHFRGSWRDPVEQIVFGFDLRLDHLPAGRVKGRLLWTLMATPPGHALASRVDEVGTEFVEGTWESETRTLRLKGTSVDSTLLATDEYRLVVAADGKSFIGKTRGNKGTWQNDIEGEQAE